MKEKIKHEMVSIPNILGYFRILLVPIYIWVYWAAEDITGYYIAAGIIALSGITDFLDGYIARKYDMITDFGKVLDPLADKLTQAALIVSLTTRYPLMIALVVLLVIKEGYMAVAGFILFKRGMNIRSAKWYGKINTAVLYLVMLFLIVFPGISITVAETLIILCGAIMLLTLWGYASSYRKIWRNLKSC